MSPDITTSHSPDPAESEPTFTPGTVSPDGEHIGEPLELTAEQRELQNFLLTMDQVRTNPEGTADSLQRLSRELYLTHLNGAAAKLAVSKTVKLIEMKEHGGGLGAKKRNIRTIDPYTPIGSDKKVHRRNIINEIKVIHQFMDAAAETLRKTAEHGLSEQETEFYAAAVLYMEDLLSNKLPRGDRDNLSGYDGKNNLRHATLEDVSKVLSVKIGGYHSTAAALERPPGTRESEETERSSTDPAVRDEKTPETKEPAKEAVLPTFERLVKADFTEMSAHIRTNQKGVAKVLDMTIEHAKSDVLNDRFVSHYREVFSKLFKDIPDKNDTSDEGLRKFGNHVRDIMTSINELDSDIKHFITLRDAPGTPEPEFVPFPEITLTEEESNVIRSLETNPDEALDELAAVADVRNPLDSDVLSAVARITNGELKLSEVNKSDKKWLVEHMIEMFERHDKAK